MKRRGEKPEEAGDRWIQRSFKRFAVGRNRVIAAEVNLCSLENVTKSLKKKASEWIDLRGKISHLGPAKDSSEWRNHEKACDTACREISPLLRARMQKLIGVEPTKEASGERTIRIKGVSPPPR